MTRPGKLTANLIIGGAAHLPGMLAAYARTVPVIGLPIKPTLGDGMDSLLSITNMPKGVSTASVGINNGTNAALQAAKHIAVYDDGVRARLEMFIERAARESLANDENLRKQGEQDE